MNKDKFKIVSIIKELIVVIDENLINFPRKDIELKSEIVKLGYSLLFEVQYGNITSDPLKRIASIEKSLTIIKQMDFLITRCYEKQIINHKKYYRFGESLDRIIRYLVAWLNSTNASSNNRA